MTEKRFHELIEAQDQERKKAAYAALEERLREIVKNQKTSPEEFARHMGALKK